jgi:hypothetical protein
MTSLALPTENCGKCYGVPGTLHNKNFCPYSPDYIVPTAESIQAEEERRRKEEEVLAAKRAAIDVKTLIYDITDVDGEEWGGSRDKIIIVRIIDGDKVIGEWSIYFDLRSGTSSGAGKARRFYHTAHLGRSIHIEEEYRNQGLSRFMGKKLS